MLEMRDTCEACGSRFQMTVLRGSAVSNARSARRAPPQRKTYARTVAANSWLARADRPNTAAASGSSGVPSRGC